MGLLAMEVYELMPGLRFLWPQTAFIYSTSLKHMAHKIIIANTYPVIHYMPVIKFNSFVGITSLIFHDT